MKMLNRQKPWNFRINVKTYLVNLYAATGWTKLETIIYFTRNTKQGNTNICISWEKDHRVDVVGGMLFIYTKQKQYDIIIVLSQSNGRNKGQEGNC